MSVADASFPLVESVSFLDGLGFDIIIFLNIYVYPS